MDYQEKILDLISMNFTFIPINADILLLALEKDGGIPQKIFDKCLKDLVNSATRNSAANVISNFLIEYSRKPLLDIKKTTTFSHVLNYMAKRRDGKAVLNIIISLINQKLKVSPVEIFNIITMIRDWERGRSNIGIGLSF